MTDAPRVLAVIVAHDGMAWLDRALTALSGQTYTALEILAVDNASQDGSRQVLFEHLGEERVLVSDRDLGFTGAISMALDSGVAASAAADHILLVHDDLVLAPDAVERLVAHLVSDPRLGVVGPKLLTLDDPRRLQQVGMSIDLIGRSDSGLETDELDHGQRDRPRQVLYVSSAGMMVRRELMEALGRFDPRYGVFREDLDLCWRAWISGEEVEVVPDAVGHHARATADRGRLGDTASAGPRFLSERNTLATLLKCYGRMRLLLALPLYLVVGVAKLLGFVAVRRVHDAWETLRAWAWNVRNLRTTWRLRAQVQAGRVRSDRELSPLFVRSAPRLRAYVEAVSDRILGGDASPAVYGPELPARSMGRGGFLRRRPGLAVFGAIVVLVLVGGVPILGTGDLRGGDLAAWPQESAELIRTYVSGWGHGAAFSDPTPSSPAQALLGFLGLLALDSGWLASRIIVLGAIPMAWLTAVQAARLVARRPAPRALAATLYALSPPALAAVRTGRIGAIVVLVTLPLFVLAVIRMVDLEGPRDTAWRATAATVLLAALMVAFEPPVAIALVLATAVGLVAIAGAGAAASVRREAGARLIVALAGTAIVLAPWTFTLFTRGSPVLGGFHAAGAEPASVLRWLLLVPPMPGFPGLVVGSAFLAAGVLGVSFAARRSTWLVGSLSALVVAGTAAAWMLGRAGEAALAWPGLVLIGVALAYAALLALGLNHARSELVMHAFGWRQIAASVLVGLVGIGGIGAAAHLVTAGWDAFRVGDAGLPSFVSAEAETIGFYRVLVLADDGERIRWDLTGPTGPTVMDFAGSTSPALAEVIGPAVHDVVAGADPGAANRLGLASVRYVYVPEGGRSEDLDRVLAEQIALEPQPVERGSVYVVRGWLPRVAFLRPDAAAAVARRDVFPSGSEPRELERVDAVTWRGPARGRGAVALAEPPEGRWSARLDDRALQRTSWNGLTRFAVPSSGTIELRYEGGSQRAVAVGVQALLVALTISLALRPPRFARRAP